MMGRKRMEKSEGEITIEKVVEEHRETGAEDIKVTDDAIRYFDPYNLQWYHIKIVGGTLGLQ
jgi:hypothetical protein